MLLLLLVAGYRSVAHYLVLTQQASGATATEQAAGEEAATSSAEPDVQPNDVPVQEGNIAEPSGALLVCLVIDTPATWCNVIS